MAKFLSFFLVLLLIGFSSTTFARDKYFYSAEQCNKLSDPSADRIIEIEEMFQDLLKFSGLKGSYYLCPITSSIAYATNAGGLEESILIIDQHIAYNSRFMRTLRDEVGYWGVYGILAHELAHHHLGHTRDGRGSNPKTELEADFLAGKLMQLSGASVENAVILPSQPFLQNGGRTHPMGRDRIVAFRNGWRQGCQTKSTPQCANHVKKAAVIEDDPNYQETNFYLQFMRLSESYKGRTITDEYCKLYTKVSLQQTKRNKTQRCGYLVDTHAKNRWSTDTAGQYGWCMSISAHASGKEVWLRESALKHCIQVEPVLKQQKSQKKLACSTGSAMHKAAARGNSKFIKECLIAGADVNLRESKRWTPLHSAARNGQLAMVKLLIKQKAQINPKDASQRTPLDQAILAKHNQVAAYLRSKGGVTRP